MKKKIRLGSIFAVAILILLSFTSVVGYRTNSSVPVDKSPLFGIRTNRAIEQDNNLCSSYYIGKGEEINIHFPEKDNEIELLRKFIEAISQMDDKAYKELIMMIISRVNEDEELGEIGAHKVLIAFNLMRIYPDEVKKQILNDGEIVPRFNTSGYLCALLSIIAGIIALTLLWLYAKIDGYISRIYPTECQGTCLAFTCDYGYTFCQERCLKGIGVKYA